MHEMHLSQNNLNVSAILMFPFPRVCNAFITTHELEHKRLSLISQEELLFQFYILPTVNQPQILYMKPISTIKVIVKNTITHLQINIPLLIEC